MRAPNTSISAFPPALFEASRCTHPSKRAPTLRFLIRAAAKKACSRRLHGAADRMGHLVSGHSLARGRAIDWSSQQVTVVDIHSLHATAQLFVVGVLLKRMMEQKELQGGSRPLVFVVLDELNKY